MALFKIFKGDSGNLEANRPQRQEGFIYLTEDEMKFYIDTSTSTHTTAASLTQAEKEYRQPLNASKADLLQSWETNPQDAGGTWTVNIPGITAAKLIDGLTIRIRIMTTYDSKYNTLNVNGLGAKLVYFRYNTPLTSHLPQYAEMVLTYRTAHMVGSVNYTGASSTSRTYGNVNYGTDGWVLDSSYSDGNTYDRILNSAEMRRAGVELTATKLCMTDENGLLQPISIGTTATGKTANTTPLQLPRMVYYASNTKINAYGLVGQNTLYEDVPFNPTNTINTTMGPYSDLYLVGTLNDNGYFVLDSTNTTSYYKIVQEPSSSSLANNIFVKGKYYLYVGSSRNADNLVHLMPYHQLYYCLDDNGKKLTAVSPMSVQAIGGLNNAFVQTITTGTESGKITLNGITTSILYGRPNTILWNSTNAGLFIQITNTDDSTVTSNAMPTIKVEWGGTGRTSLTSGQALIGNGTNAVNFRAIYTRTTVGTLDWNSGSNEYLVTKGAIAYWNGAYSGTSSNLAYCAKGKFGSIITADKGDWTANCVAFTSSTTKIDSATSLYTTGANLAVNKASITTGYKFEVNGASRLDGKTIHTADIGIISGDTDKYINWWYNTNETAGASWRIGMQGTGTGDTNYFAIQSGTSTTSSTTWTTVLKFGQNTFDAIFASNVNPQTDNTKDLGTETLRWRKIYAVNFVGDGSLLENLNADKISSGTLKVPRGGTGANSFTKNNILYGNGTQAIQGATSILADASHLTINSTTLNTSYNLYNVGTSRFDGDITMKPGGTPSSYPWVSNKIIFNGGTDGADIYYSVQSADAGRLWLNTRDDANCLIALGYNGTAKAYFANSTPSFYPATTNTGSLGIASNRWSKVYIGTADTYGSDTRPIYWNEGVPTALSVNIGTKTRPVYVNAGTITQVDYEIKATLNDGTANRMAYYSGTNAISSANSIYATASALAINKTSAPANSGSFQVVGTSTLRTTLPEATNSYALGSSSLRWSKVYVGTADTYGSTSKPIYWDDGVPTPFSATIGSSERGVYVNAGTLTALTWYPHSCTITSSNQANYPWHRVATCKTGTGQYVDKSVILVLHQRFNGGFYGIIKLAARTNSTNAAINISAQWLVRIGIAENAIRICKKGNTGTDAQIDVYVKVGTYARAIAYILEGSNLGWSLVNSNEVANTTSSNKGSSVEVWADITTSQGATAYDTITSSVDSGVVSGLSDSKDGSTITATYNTDALTTTSWFTIWNGYVLQKITPANGLKAMVGTSTIGSTNKPIYWNGDSFAAFSTNIGSGTQPVWIEAGVIKNTTYALKATVNNGTTPRVAYYSGANAISSAPNLNYINNIDVTYNSQTMKQNGLRIWGATYGNTANQLKANTAGKISFGDGGPQIQFSTSESAAQDGALIYTDHDACGAGASLHFVTNQSDWNFHSKRFVADTSVTIGDYTPNTSYALYVNGTTFIAKRTTISGPLVCAQDHNFISHGNEFNFLPTLSSNIEVHINYRQLDSNGAGIVSKYHLKNGTNAYSDLYLKSIVGSGTLTMTGTATITTCVGKNMAIWDGDQLKKITPQNMADTLFTLTTITKSLKLTQTWQDTGIASNNIPDTGTYIIQVVVNGAGTSGTSQQYSEYYSGVMSWFATGTNSSDADEIVLHKAGHASQGQNIYLRTVRGPSGTLKLQYKFTADKTVNENVQFKFRKVI